MTTSEITYGSRWDQEETDRDPGKYEERFLVKWEGLSFLHCSWETEKDLIELCEGAKTRMSTFFRKAENGLLYDVDERLDGVSIICFKPQYLFYIYFSSLAVANLLFFLIIRITLTLLGLLLKEFWMFLRKHVT